MATETAAPDAVLAANVRTALARLNAAIADATKAGLWVDADVVSSDVAALGGRAGEKRVMLDVTVYRPL